MALGYNNCLFCSQIISLDRQKIWMGEVLSAMPIKNARYRFKKTGPRTRQRFAFVGKEVREITSYRKKNGVWVRSHTRRIK